MAAFVPDSPRQRRSRWRGLMRDRLHYDRPRQHRRASQINHVRHHLSLGHRLGLIAAVDFQPSFRKEYEACLEATCQLIGIK